MTYSFDLGPTLSEGGRGSSTFGFVRSWLIEGRCGTRSGIVTFDSPLNRCSTGGGLEILRIGVEKSSYHYLSQTET